MILSIMDCESEFTNPLLCDSHFKIFVYFYYVVTKNILSYLLQMSISISSFQDNLPETGIKEDAASMDTLFRQWSEERSKQDTKFLIVSFLINRNFVTKLNKLV